MFHRHYLYINNSHSLSFLTQLISGGIVLMFDDAIGSQWKSDRVKMLVTLSHGHF